MKRGFRALGTVMVALFACCIATSAQGQPPAGPPDVMIHITGNPPRITKITPFIKGLCLSAASPIKDCGQSVVWKVTGLPNKFSVGILQKGQPPQPQCFQATTWTIATGGGTADSGTSSCVAGQLWKYDVVLVDDSGEDPVVVQTVDPMIVFDP